MKKQKIIFFGTPEFAVPSLQALIDRKENIIGVITQPDRKVGRGLKLKIPPIKELALEHDIKILQPENIRDPKFISQFQKFSADLAVVAAYGQIFPKTLLEIPSNGKPLILSIEYSMALPFTSKSGKKTSGKKLSSLFL